MNKQSKPANETVVDKLLSGTAGEKYQGKQVVIIGGKIHILPEDDRESAELVNRLEQKHPDQTPHLVFVPRPETYIL